MNQTKVGNILPRFICLKKKVVYTYKKKPLIGMLSPNEDIF